ncbi:hypothetical protein [Cryptosporangium japonicum]|uniref:Uncharacterized protein n=1 Tax=Cryptosporangium japonicum TaxID=80872 RepID=A0ABP3ELF2_9ACTN
MPVPALIPIAREPGYRTDTIGRFAEGQFYAVVHGARRNDDDELDLRRERVRWYAYLHRFDHAGNHVDSKIALIGIGPYLRGELRRRAEERLRELLDELADPDYGDIAIRPFRVVHDGVTFGLIDESEAEWGDWVELYPDRLVFTDPWDGTYNT